MQGAGPESGLQVLVFLFNTMPNEETPCLVTQPLNPHECMKGSEIRMWGRKSDGMYQDIRQKWLGGAVLEAAGSQLRPNDVVAVMMEFRVGKQAATLVGAEDGTASLYLESGGGIIGMGFHAQTAAASLALVGCGRSYLDLFPVVKDFPLPGKGNQVLRVITRAGVHSVEFAEKETRDDLPIAPFVSAAGHLLTNARLLDERTKQGGIRPHAIYVHVFADGGVCVLVPPLTTGTWLTPLQLKRVLEIAKSQGDRLQVYVEPGDERIQAPVQGIIAESGLSRAPGEVEKALGYSGGTTTLLNAVEDARLDIVEELLNRGANLESQDARGYTPLILAAYRGRNPIIHLLVKSGANVNARDRHGNSVLLFASQHGDAQIVKSLMEVGADPNVRGQNGYTALKVAKLTGHDDLASFLESKGAVE